MVLYIEALRWNVTNFIQVATTLKAVLERLGVEAVGYDESIETCRANLVVLDGLLAAGITKLEVPEKK